MKLLSIIKKSIKEQFRSFWVLLLTLSCAPFFVFVYYLIDKSTQPNYNVLMLVEDTGVDTATNAHVNFGDKMLNIFNSWQSDTGQTPIHFSKAIDKQTALSQLKNSKANLLMVIPPNFSHNFISLAGNNPVPVDIEFIGNITNVNYLVSAVFAGDYLNKYILAQTNIPNPLNFKETGIGASGTRTSFELTIPGLLIFSIIMLMLTASIALVVESEKMTIKRLKLSNVSAFTFLTGVSFVQVLIGLLSVLVTIVTAIMLGFRMEGSFLLVLFISALCSISIISFSMILAAACKTVNHVLVIG
ncbi:MAG: ABC transporter permease, partial [Bacteroidota bacterium]